MDSLTPLRIFLSLFQGQKAFGLELSSARFSGPAGADSKRRFDDNHLCFFSHYSISVRSFIFVKLHTPCLYPGSSIRLSVDCLSGDVLFSLAFVSGPFARKINSSLKCVESLHSGIHLSLCFIRFQTKTNNDYIILLCRT